MRRNPKVYHGSHAHIQAWVASTSREFRSWETFGTFFTTNKEHARIFGKVVHELDLDAGQLRLFQAKDLWTPLFFPALHNIVPVKLKVSEKKVIHLVFQGNEKTGEGPLIEKWHEVMTSWRNAQKSDRWHDIPIEHRKRLRLRAEAIGAALEVMRKLGQDRKYIASMLAYFAEEGVDGFYWPNADHDVGSDAKGEPKYRHDVFFLFHPEKQPAGALVNPKRASGKFGVAKVSAFHRFREDHVQQVMTEMRTLGAPTIRVVREADGSLMAIEGVHRLEAAKRLGLTPKLKELPASTLVSDTGIDWQDAEPDSTLSDMMAYTDMRGRSYEFAGTLVNPGRRHDDWTGFNARRKAAIDTCNEYHPAWRADAIRLAFDHASGGLDQGYSKDQTWDNLADTMQETRKTEWHEVVEHYFDVAWAAGPKALQRRSKQGERNS